MFRDLDDTLRTILDDANAPNELRNADVSFETPDKNFAPGQPTVNLFLYQVQENRVLRDPVPITEIVAGEFVRRMPPLRVDCRYLVTAWSNQLGAARTAEEHRLLSQALFWLSRFTTIPTSFLQGSLVTQPYPPPTLIAQPEANPDQGEFWSALGIFPRSSFHATVTIAMELGVTVPEGPPVVTKDMGLTQAVWDGKELIPFGAMQRSFQIGGTVRDANTQAVIPNAQLSLANTDRSATSDAEGHFGFSLLPAGNYTLNANAAGFQAASKNIAVPAAVANAYDINLTP
jgi:hypothetical protein